jgi:protocatechuate 3,4-dioxygenase beta subunit
MTVSYKVTSQTLQRRQIQEGALKSIGLLLLGVVCLTGYAGICAGQGVVTSAGFGGSTAQQALRKVQGKVVQGDGQGIRKVKVSLSGPQQYSAVTDENGQFTFEGVEAGAYVVQLERSGYAPDQKASRERQIIKVAAEQDTLDLVFHMVAAGVLSGKIVDLDGDPLRNFTVQAIASTDGAVSIRRMPRGLQHAVTNDLGEYRIPDLPPGKYFVKATPQANEVPPPSPGDKESAKGRLAYAPTYFPGTLDKQQAAFVEVLAGATATADFGVQTSRVYRVSGTIVGLSWPPIPKPTETENEGQGQIAVLMASAGNGQILLIGKTGEMKQERFARDGKFEFTDVLPGTYQAQVMIFSMSGMSPSLKMQKIRAPIEVNGADVDGLQLQVEPGGDVSGKFRMDSDEKIDWKGLNVALLEVPEPGTENPGFGVMGGGVSMVKQDGSFEIKDASAGEYQLYVGASSDKYRDYYTKSVLLHGQEVADTGFTVGPGTVLDVVVSAKGAAIEGTVVDGAGKPVPDATVVTVPSSGKLGRPDAYQSGQTDEKGHFLLRGMNPGEFLVLAFEQRQGNSRSPEFAAKYESQGEKVQLDEGAKKTVALKLIQEP